MRRRRRRTRALERPGDDGDLRRASLVVRQGDARNIAAPQHREVRSDKLVGLGEVEPDLKELEWIRLVLPKEREHLAMDDAGACRQPLNVPRAETCGSSKRIGMIDGSASKDRDRLEAAMRMLREAGDDFAVVHAPAVFDDEVLPEVAPGEGCGRAELVVSFGIGVVVMNTEEEGVSRAPGKAERVLFSNCGVVHRSYTVIMRCEQAIAALHGAVSVRCNFSHEAVLRASPRTSLSA